MKTGKREEEELTQLRQENRMLRETIRQLNETLHKMIERYIMEKAPSE